MKLLIIASLGGLAIASVSASARGQEMVPFVIPTGPNPDCLITVPPSPAIEPAGPRLVARDGHFFRGTDRVRIWGVNLCFGADFPAKADAEQAAERLARFGVNSVRLHHMDSQAFPDGIWDRKDPMKLSVEALDRLDYFIDQLARRGIWVNVNLHVSRTHSQYLDLPKEGPTPSYDKITDIFTPALINAQKRYARDLLGHVNAYRKVRYADDPAVAFVEITNEDSLFMWGAEGTIRSLPAFYADLLRKQYSAWLSKRYGSDDGLRRAWSQGASPLGQNMLADTAFTLAVPEDPNQPHWQLELHAPCKATARQGKEKNSVRIEFQTVDQTDWHIQFKQPNLKLKVGQYYTVIFRARADKPRRITVGVGQAHDPWRNLGLGQPVQLTDQWMKVRTGFVAMMDEDNARLSFSVGGGDAAVEIADVVLAGGGREGLKTDESPQAANVALFAESEVEARTLDRWRFLAEREKEYFADMRTLINGEIGCKALVTGTIVFGPLGLYGQSDMDFIDTHSYWLHPHFPGRPWDPGNWIVEQRAMTDNPAGMTLTGLAACRLAGKPFTVSEYNHSAPNDYQAECVPIIAAFAAAQDWDGIWLFAYSHRRDQWHGRHYTSFFDIDLNPSKWGFIPAGTAMFRDFGLTALPAGDVRSIAPGDKPLDGLIEHHRRRNLDMDGVLNDQFKLTWQGFIARGVWVTFGARAATAPPPLKSLGQGDTRIDWTVQDKRGRFIATGHGAYVETGWAPGPDGKPTFRAVTVTALDGRSLADSGKVLIAACGRCENTGMKFSADRRTVGRDWGGDPVCIEAVQHSLRLAAWAGRKARLQPLSPDGKPQGEPIALDLDAQGALTLSPNHKTMWYLLVRE